MKRILSALLVLFAVSLQADPFISLDLDKKKEPRPACKSWNPLDPYCTPLYFHGRDGFSGSHGISGSPHFPNGQDGRDGQDGAYAPPVAVSLSISGTNLLVEARNAYRSVKVELPLAMFPLPQGKYVRVLGFGGDGGEGGRGGRGFNGCVTYDPKTRRCLRFVRGRDGRGGDGGRGGNGANIVVYAGSGTHEYVNQFMFHVSGGRAGRGGMGFPSGRLGFMGLTGSVRVENTASFAKK